MNIAVKEQIVDIFSWLAVWLKIERAVVNPASILYREGV
jgi:hypothetical protein